MCQCAIFKKKKKKFYFLLLCYIIYYDIIFSIIVVVVLFFVIILMHYYWNYCLSSATTPFHSNCPSSILFISCSTLQNRVGCTNSYACNRHVFLPQCFFSFINLSLRKSCHTKAQRNMNTSFARYLRKMSYFVCCTALRIEI